MTNIAPTVTATMSLLCLVGGYMGYSRKGSVASLVAGSLVAVLYSAAAVLLTTSTSARRKMGRVVGLLASMLLTFGMGQRAVVRAAPESTSSNEPGPHVIMFVPAAVAAMGAMAFFLIFFARPSRAAAAHNDDKRK
jgi:uncharacterized membrane protein (UPF0136 family)